MSGPLTGVNPNPFPTEQGGASEVSKMSSGFAAFNNDEMKSVSEIDLKQPRDASAPLNRNNNPMVTISKTPGEFSSTKGHKVSKLVKIGVPVVGALAIAAIVTLGILASQGLLGVAAQTFMSNSWTWIQATVAKGLTGAKALAAKVGTWVQNNTGAAIGIGAGAGIALVAIAALGIHKLYKHKKQNTAPYAAEKTTGKERGSNIFRRIWTMLPSCPRISMPHLGRKAEGAGN